MVAFSSAYLSRGPGPRVSREWCPRSDPASPSRRLRLDLRAGRPSVHRPMTRAVPGDSGQRSHLPTALPLSPQRMHRQRARRPSHGRAGCGVAALRARPDSASHPWSSTQEEPPHRVTLSPAPHPTAEACGSVPSKCSRNSCPVNEKEFKEVCKAASVGRGAGARCAIVTPPPHTSHGSGQLSRALSQ